MNVSKKIMRYVVSGITATGFDLFLLFLFKSVFHIWYLLSAVLAFILSFGVSFFLQKFWTFEDNSTHKVKSQASMYFLITLFNLGLNTFLVYIFVDKVGIQYLLSQIIASGLIAFGSYFVYGKFIFQKDK